ncbi:hypothetical protein FWG95_03690 [Candidatus Saccharibacteria bacterium]|nr:hypothetical protein [Candidatus Saccharibacteria bacterium]
MVERQPDDRSQQSPAHFTLEMMGVPEPKPRQGDTMAADAARALSLSRTINEALTRAYTQWSGIDAGACRELSARSGELNRLLMDLEYAASYYDENYQEEDS